MASDHFEDVLILEPESWLATEEGKSNTYDEHGTPIQTVKKSIRTRVQQHDAIHGMYLLSSSYCLMCNCLLVFQPLARDALRKFFPDFDDEVRRAHGR